VRVRELMTADVATVTPETPLRDAARVLAERGISGMPVVDADGAVVGVLSEGDILVKEGAERPKGGLLGWLLEPGLWSETKLEARTAGDAMTAPPITIGPGRPVHEAARLMLAEGVNRLPVVDDGRLVGILTRADLVRAFSRDDEQIRTEIVDEVLRRTLWIEPGRITVRVEDGVVTLEGRVDTPTDAELLPRFVERVPGVVSVESRVTSAVP
jgi:CBS domain-containing protein